jgi:hypothetical protein
MVIFYIEIFISMYKIYIKQWAMLLNLWRDSSQKQQLQQ